MIKLIECPRDAMQGFSHFIPTDVKARYINLLLQVGFDTIDFGSFVSPKAIPQMRDTQEVLERIDLSSTNSKLLAIVANLRGVEEVVRREAITYLGFPFSVSETFQQRNTNSSREASLDLVDALLDSCNKYQKKAVIYLSMGFGNPYDEPWSYDLLAHWADKLVDRGAEILALSDTTGVSTPEKIRAVFPLLVQQFPRLEWGLHLHSKADSWQEKIEAAYQSGCKRFDSALKGFGGCPMAADELVGNIATENLLRYLSLQGENLGLNLEKWELAMAFSTQVFSQR